MWDTLSGSPLKRRTAALFTQVLVGSAKETICTYTYVYYTYTILIIQMCAIYTNTHMHIYAYIYWCVHYCLSKYTKIYISIFTSLL